MQCRLQALPANCRRERRLSNNRAKHYRFIKFNVCVVSSGEAGYAFGMNADKPIYGTYQSPEGLTHELRTPMEVYEVFRGLLKRMPAMVHDRRNPKRFAVVAEAKKKAA